MSQSTQKRSKLLICRWVAWLEARLWATRFSVEENRHARSIRLPETAAMGEDKGAR